MDEALLYIIVFGLFLFNTNIKAPVDDYFRNLPRAYRRTS